MKTGSIRCRMTMWYAGLLAGALLLFGVSMYLGLEQYLKRSLEESLRKQARSIGETLLVNVNRSGEAYVLNEISEHYAPEINGRLIRIRRADGSLLYLSGLPKDGSFDPSGIPSVLLPVTQEFSHELEMPGGSELLIHVLPYTTREGNRFLIEIGVPYRQVEAVLRGFLLTFALGFPVIVAMAIGGGYLLMRKALRPVDEITQRAEQITSRNLSERLPIVQTEDELERLSVALNGMIARLEDAFQHVKRFSADASHELRTPLTALRGELETIAQRPQLPPDLRETIGSALEESERLAKIVDNLLTISRLDAGEARMERVRFDLVELSTTTMEQMRLLAEEKGISLQSNGMGPVEVEGDRAHLKQVIVNLVDNAINYTQSGGFVQVVVSTRNGRALLDVIDNGVGISAQALPHIFERFYRGEEARSRHSAGAGLGLSIVKSICSAHGGEVRVESTEGQSTRFTVDLALANIN